MPKPGSTKRGQSDKEPRRRRPNACGRVDRSSRPLRAAGGRGLGKAGARRLGQMLKRVIQGDQNGKGKRPDQQPTTPIRLLKQKAQSIAQTQATGGRTKVAAPRVSHLILEVISQCKRRGGISMEELKQALAAGGYDVTKNNARVNLAMKGLVKKETIVQTAGQGISGSFIMNKKLSEEKRVRTRAMRKRDAGTTSASKKPKPKEHNENPGPRQLRKGDKAAVQRPKTITKDVKLAIKAQSQVRKSPKKQGKLSPKTKPKSHR